MPSSLELIDRLEACPKGQAGWREYEQIVAAILTYLFVPPLVGPTEQPRSFSGIDRRDAIFGNRDMSTDTVWGQLRQELNARMPLFEFKNFDGDIGKDEVDQTRNYLTRPIGKLAIICCRNPPGQQALLRRNHAYTQEGKVILFIDDEGLKEMIRIKERGDDPVLYIMDLVEYFYIQHE